MKASPDINETLCNEGEESVRARHDRAEHFNGKDSDEAEAEALPFVDISTWRVNGAPRREWGVHDRFPLRNVTLLSGEGRRR